MFCPTRTTTSPPLILLHTPRSHSAELLPVPPSHTHDNTPTHLQRAPPLHTQPFFNSLLTGKFKQSVELGLVSAR